MIEKLEFARTGHMSSRVIFGAAALGGMSQPRADATLESLLAYKESAGARAILRHTWEIETSRVATGF